jgi:hypothetical protein
MSRVATPPVAKPVSPGQATTPTSPSSPTGAIPREKIAMRAYEKWMKGGCQHGSDRQHWLEAEAELRAEHARTGTRR